MFATTSQMDPEENARAKFGEMLLMMNWVKGYMVDLFCIILAGLIED